MSNIAPVSTHLSSPVREQEEQLPELALGAASLILDDTSLDRILRWAEIMASGKITTPVHLRGNVADCVAVCSQAMQWGGMNPFPVAQKTFVSQSGVLGYEAQLVNAVIIARAPIKQRPDFQFYGEWSRILGKIEERKSDKGGKYYVAVWKKEEEEGLGVICSATLRGENKPREVNILLTQCWPRFSTQWATDPMQQITYAAVKKWARRFAPDVVLGVNTDDDLEPAGEKFMGAADVVDHQLERQESRSQMLKDKVKHKTAAPTLDEVVGAILAATTPDAMRAAAKLAEKLESEADKATARERYAMRLHELQPVTFAQVAAKINDAMTVDDVDLARDLIKSMADAAQQDELREIAKQRVMELVK